MYFILIPFSGFTLGLDLATPVFAGNKFSVFARMLYLSVLEDRHDASSQSWNGWNPGGSESGEITNST
jgi:hypothetical protein